VGVSKLPSVLVVPFHLISTGTAMGHGG